jgi:acetyl esterase/lipase
MKAFIANLMQAAKKRPGEVSEKVTPSTENQRGNEIFALAVADGREAVKYVRTHAAEWSIDPDRIGMMGFSAGAGVTMGVLLDHPAGSQINFAAPIYGGGTDGRPVPTDSPPLFLVVAQDDHLTSEGVEKLHRQWNDAGLPVELHSFAQGGHGFGMVKQGLPVDHWIDLYADWLDSLGLMKRGDRPHRSLDAPTSEPNKR